MSVTRTESTETVEDTVYYVNTVLVSSGKSICEQRFTDVTLEELQEVLAKRKQSDDIRREITFETTYKTVQSTVIRGAIA